VVFDIDNTLSDGRARTLAVGKAWDKANGTHFFDVPRARIGHDAGDTAATLGIPAEKREAWAVFWERQFWAPESFVHDAPIPAAVELVKAAKRAGAEVVYLTGRIQTLEQATIDQLRRFGLPDVDADHVVTKPSVETRTTAYRTGWLKDHQPESIALFFTESRRDLSDAQAQLPKLPAVLLKSAFGGDTPVRADTPIFRADK
jgi:phosphoglycolate phosphatase-like HAD superfamily hydrolase